MYQITILFVSGVCALYLFDTLPLPAALLAASLACGLLGTCRLRVLAALPLGFVWAVLHTALVQSPVLDPALEGRTVHVIGTVTEVPAPHGKRFTRLMFHAEQLDDGTGWRDFAARLQLGWYGAGDPPAGGERWRFAVRLKRPYGMANPGGFDYERWLFQRRIRATGYVRDDPRNARLPGGQLPALSGFRQRLIRAFAQLGDATGPAFVRALTVGERSAIGSAQWRVLNVTGTSHLMAISGLHISLVAGLAFWLTRRGWSLLGRITDFLPAPRVAAAGAICAAVLYALLAGFGIPARRALLMVCVLMLALLSDRRARFARVICLAALGTLALDPLSVLAAGWWLSFLAVITIAWLAAGRYGTPRRLRQCVLLHAGLALCMAPLLLLMFQQASLLAPLANLVAVPVVGLLVVPLALLGCLLFALDAAPGIRLLGVAALLLELAWPLLQMLAATELAAWTRHAPPWWTLPPALAGLGILCMPRGIPGRWLGGVMLLPLLLIRPPVPAAGEVWITLLDVGQGLSAVVRTAGHTLVYDAGPRFSPDFDTGQAVVVPFLRRQGIRRLDTLVVSHGDNDHIGGVPSLLAAYPAESVFSSVPERLPGRGAEFCRRGRRWQWDGIGFAFLHPDSDSAHSGNNASCVLRIETTNGQRLLLPGDIEQAAESQLVARQGGGLRSAVLVAPHHGSATSSSPAFVAAVDPEFVIVPAAWRNRYGFPKQAVSDRYRSAGARILETGRSGAVSVKLSSSSAVPEITGWRDRYRHLWSWHD